MDASLWIIFGLLVIIILIVLVILLFRRDMIKLFERHFVPMLQTLRNVESNLSLSLSSNAAEHKEIWKELEKHQDEINRIKKRLGHD